MQLQRENRIEASLEGWGMKAALGVAVGSTNEEQKKLKTQDVLKALQETEDRFEWTGEKFIMKPMDLRDLFNFALAI